jgi:hypothetical protein
MSAPKAPQKKQAAPSKRKNEDVREQPRKQIELKDKEQVQVSAVGEVPAKRQNKRSKLIEEPVDLNMFPVTNLHDQLTCNKTLGANRMIFMGSEIRQRGMRGYYYYLPDQGQGLWSYRPLGTHQPH